MKKIIFFGILATLLSCHHVNKDQPIAAIDHLPAFNMLLVDSITLLQAKQIPTGKPIIIMYFRPDCTHCQAETKDLIKNIDLLKNTQIYLLTPMSFEEMKYFYDSYGLGRFKNITVGKDEGYTFYKTFKPKGVPYVAIYNGQKKLVQTYMGAQITMNNIVKSIQL